MSSMASPTTTIRRPRALLRSPTRRSRERESAMAAEASGGVSEGQFDGRVRHRPCPPAASSGALSKTHITRDLSDLLRRFNESAKGKVLTVQEYFTLAWKSLRFIFARPFYAQDLVQQ